MIPQEEVLRKRTHIKIKGDQEIVSVSRLPFLFNCYAITILIATLVGKTQPIVLGFLSESLVDSSNAVMLFTKSIMIKFILLIIFSKSLIISIMSLQLFVESFLWLLFMGKS